MILISLIIVKSPITPHSSLSISIFYKDFNIAFDFPLFFNWAIFSLDIAIQYLNFAASYVKLEFINYKHILHA